MLIALAKDLCMQLLLLPRLCFSEMMFPQELVQKEIEIAQAQAEGKPPQAFEKIVHGKLDKYFQFLFSGAVFC